MTPADFIERYSRVGYAETREAAAVIADPHARSALYSHMHANPDPSYGPLLRALLHAEVDYRAEEPLEDEGEPEADFTNNIYWCGFLLSRLGQLEDVGLLWEAKNIDFDTGCSFDVQFLVGAGLEETIDFLKNGPDSRSAEILEYIVRCKRAGDFDNLAEWYAWRDHYFA